MSGFVELTTPHSELDKNEYIAMLLTDESNSVALFFYVQVTNEETGITQNILLKDFLER